jgi:hypothetical protein
MEATGTVIVWGARGITSAFCSNVASQKDGNLGAQYVAPVTSEVPSKPASMV